MMANRGLCLGVNVDHVATLRQVRGSTYPDPLQAAEECRKAGADGITMHLREDRRHVQEADVRAVRDWKGLPLNLEMANVPEIVKIALDVHPDEVCIVPERRRELTTEGGLDVVGQAARLRPTVEALGEAGICVSLFVEARPEQLESAAALGASCVELHTGGYCEARGEAREHELARLIAGARRAHELGLRVNAGHGINLENIKGVLRIPHLEALNIGHSIIARAVFVGIGSAVREILEIMAEYTGGERA